MKNILTRLINGEKLSREETHNILINITLEKYPDAQITAFLTALQMRGITVDELLGLRDGILETGVPVDVVDFKPIDIVGTGGDCKNTFNISTCSCFVVAAAGYKVAKHGNYAATSVSGASNVIEGHGVKFTNDNAKIRENLEKTNFVYLHAQLFAKAMKFVGGIRKALQIPTCFNLLGPIVNPAKPAYQVLGVATLKQMEIYKEVYQKLGIGYSIVHSLDGYDEISLTDDFKVSSNIYEKIFSPAELNMPLAYPGDLCGGEKSTKEDAVKVFDSVLQNTAPASQKNVVITNAAFAIKTIEQQKSIEECVSIAKEALESGKAWETLKKYVDLNS